MYSSPKAGLNAVLGIGKVKMPNISNLYAHVKLREGVFKLSRLCRIRQFFTLFIESITNCEFSLYRGVFTKCNE